MLKYRESSWGRMGYIKIICLLCSIQVSWWCLTCVSCAPRLVPVVACDSEDALLNRRIIDVFHRPGTLDFLLNFFVDDEGLELSELGADIWEATWTHVGRFLHSSEKKMRDGEWGRCRKANRSSALSCKSLPPSPPPAQLQHTTLSSCSHTFACRNTLIYQSCSRGKTWMGQTTHSETDKFPFMSHTGEPIWSEWLMLQLRLDLPAASYSQVMQAGPPALTVHNCSGIELNV